MEEEFSSGVEREQEVEELRVDESPEQVDDEGMADLLEWTKSSRFKTYPKSSVRMNVNLSKGVVKV